MSPPITGPSAAKGVALNATSIPKVSPMAAHTAALPLSASRASAIAARSRPASAMITGTHGNGSACR
jgi:hypothetical protein